MHLYDQNSVTFKKIKIEEATIQEVVYCILYIEMVLGTHSKVKVGGPLMIYV